MPTIPLKDLSPNRGQIPGLPVNPRSIRRDKLEKLKTSLTDDPEMLSLRELIVFPHDGKNIIIGGNMRYRAAKELGIKALPCKILPEDTPEDKLRAIAIKDNIGYGERDWEALTAGWETEELDTWGMDLPDLKGFEDEQATRDDKNEPFGEGTPGDSETEEKEDKDAFYRSMLVDCLYESNNSFEIPNLLIEEQAGKLILPFSPWGAETRQKKGIGTYHFYVEDYRFESIWKDPIKVLASGCVAVVEPNLSLFDTTPVAFGLTQIYKKRWIARYFQECGVKVYADLNVSRKFYEYNRMGIPKGYNAFFTRGYADRIEYLKEEHRIAKDISGKDIPNFIVYGGGKAVQEYCTENSLLYVEQLMTAKGINKKIK